MAKSEGRKSNRFVGFAAKGQEASQLRQRKHTLVRRFGIPADLLSGSLSETQRRCGKAGCRCAQGPGHPLWTLTYSVGGEKQVQVIPAASVAALEPLIARARLYRQAVAELGAINAQLVTLWRRQGRVRRPPVRAKPTSIRSSRKRKESDRE